MTVDIEAIRARKAVLRDAIETLQDAKTEIARLNSALEEARRERDDPCEAVSEAAGWDSDEPMGDEDLVALALERRQNSDLYEAVCDVLDGGVEPHDEGSTEHRVWSLMRANSKEEDDE